MPRDGSNVYHYPVGIEGEPNQTIESPSYNSFLSDIEQDLNAPRPILAGGTGANNAAEARINLGAEVAEQLVTNYDSFVFKAGSFYSAASATNAPTANAASGICYLADANNVVIEARDSSDGKLYVRRKVAGVWTAWALDSDLSGVNAAIAAVEASKVAKAGDTMTGDLTISKSASTLFLNKPSATSDMLVQGSTANITRWNVCLGDSTVETGSNAGSNFSLNAFNDAGTYLFTPLFCPRATGLVQVIGNPTAALGIATKGYVDIADAGAVRHDAAQTLNTTQKRQAASNQFQGVTMNYITGSGTYTTPAGVLWIEIELVGGGGGGAGSGIAPNNGANGLISSWGIGPILSSGVAIGAVASTGGTGGIPSGGGMNKSGGGGGNGSGANSSPGGAGGNSPFGGAGASGAAGGGAGGAAVANSGSGGGGGGVSTNPNGGGGGGAGGYVRHIINNPLASYPVVIGVGGGGGSGGSGGAAGGAGGNGCIVVTEHYQ